MSEVLPSVHLIDTFFQGQQATVAVYLLTAPNGEAALIETGPGSTVDTVIAGIRAAGIDPARIRDIVVTHIHLDHSGGAGVLLRDYMPEARVYVHPVGQPHLVDPSRLVRSATRLYGERMESLWGEVAPVPDERTVVLDDGARLELAGHGLEVLYTPGHAEHHFAVRHLASNAIFCGDVAGVRVPGARVISPPTVPPEYDLVAWEASIDRLLALEPSVLLLGHYGPWSDVPAHMERLRQRLRERTQFVREGLGRGESIEEMGRELRERDAADPATTILGARQLDLAAGYAMSVAGIARYLQKGAE